MFERFTQAARAAVVRAQQTAREQGAPAIGSEHLLLGVLADEEGVPAAVLRRWDVDAAQVAATVQTGVAALDDEALSALGIDLDEVRRRTEDAFGPGALDRASGSSRGVRATKGHLPFTTEARAALGASVRSAVLGPGREIGSAQLFLGLLAAEEGTAVRTLRHVGVDASPDDLRRLVRAEIGQAA